MFFFYPKREDFFILILIFEISNKFSAVNHLPINWSVLTTVSLTSNQLLWKERCLNTTSCFVFYSSSHSLRFFFLPVSLSLIPPKSALMAKALLFSGLRNQFPLFTIPVFGVAITMVEPLLIRKQSIGRRVVIAAHGMGSVVIW